MPFSGGEASKGGGHLFQKTTHPAQRVKQEEWISEVSNCDQFITKCFFPDFNFGVFFTIKHAALIWVIIERNQLLGGLC